MREAREAYDQAARLQEGLLRESPDEARYQLALANTLLNMAGLLSPSGPSRRAGTALPPHSGARPGRGPHRAGHDPAFNAELALALGDQGMFFLEAGRGSEAEAAVREAVEVHERVLAGGQLKGSLNATRRAISSISEEFSPRRARRGRRSSASGKP